LNIPIYVHTQTHTHTHSYPKVTQPALLLCHANVLLNEMLLLYQAQEDQEVDAQSRFGRTRC